MKNPVYKPLVFLARRCSTRLLVFLLIVTTCAFIILLIKYISTSLLNLQHLHKPIYADWVDKYDSSGEAPVEDVVIKISKESHAGLSARGTVFGGPVFDDDNIIKIGIGCAITTRNNEKLNLDNLAYQLPFLRTLLPSFCKTASPNYRYNFYVAFDAVDQHLRKHEILNAVHTRFVEIVKLLCPRKSNITLQFVQCRHDRSPTWAQNDAMIEAYMDHVDYYYRVNDDTLMQTPGWTETFIEGLKSFSPPNVGVVGPLHTGGNEEILTYDFVHRSHIDIFGYYYPRVFTDWWADNWMSLVYGGERTLKLPGVRLIHTGEAGTRYNIAGRRERYLREQVEEDQATLKRYLQSLEQRAAQTNHSTVRRVISMSLWGSAPRYTFGALRNAQLAPVYFPDWTLRLYVEEPREDGSTSFAPVPDRILTKLKRLGVELVGVNAASSRVPPMMWRFLVADDINIDVFIVRDSDCRLNDRDAIVVSDWLSSGAVSAPFHCIRDHPSHTAYPLLGGLWGAKTRQLAELVRTPWQELMMGHRSDYIQDMNFLAQAIWPKVEKHSLCHDSVSCVKWNAQPFPVRRKGTEHLGQVFDAFGNARDEDIQLLLEHDPVPQCTAERVESGSVTGKTSSNVTSKVTGAVKQSEHGAVRQSEHGAVRQSEHGAVKQSEHGASEHRNSSDSRVNDVDLAGNAVSKVDLAGNAVSKVDLAGNSVNKVDLAGNSVSNVGPAGNTVRNVGPAGNTVSNVDPAGSSVRKVDLAGNTVDNVDLAGNTVDNFEGSNVVNGVDRAVKHGTYIDRAGNTVGKVDTAGNTVGKVDLAGITVSKVDKAGNTIGNMDLAGNSVKKVDIAGNSVSNLDKAGRSVSNRDAAGNTVGNLDASGNTAGNLDAAGNTVGNLDAAGNTVRNLDAAGNTVGKLDAAGNTVPNLDAAGSSGSNRDAAGNTVGNLDAAGNTAGKLDAAGNTVRNLDVAGNTVDNLDAAGKSAANRNKAADSLNYKEGAVNKSLNDISHPAVAARGFENTNKHKSKVGKSADHNGNTVDAFSRKVEPVNSVGHSDKKMTDGSEETVKKVKIGNMGNNKAEV